MYKAALGLVALVTASTTVYAQSKPEFYGVYALVDGAIRKLEGKPVSQIATFFGATGIIKHAPTNNFKTGNIRFIIYRRELTISAPDSVFVNIIAKVAREKAYGMNGQLTKDQPVSGLWVIRDRGYKLLVAPYADSKEMILIRNELSDFAFPNGRFVFSYGDQYYDFMVAQESTSPEHCVDWVARASGMSVSFPMCSLSPPAAASSSVQFTKLDELTFTFEEKHLASMEALRKVIPAAYRLVDWIYRLNGISGPVFKITIGDKAYFGARVCKPHDCADNRMAFMAAEDGSRAMVAIAVRDYFNGQPEFVGTRKPEERETLLKLFNMN